MIIITAIYDGLRLVSEISFSAFFDLKIFLITHLSCLSGRGNNFSVFIPVLIQCAICIVCSSYECRNSLRYGSCTFCEEFQTVRREIPVQIVVQLSSMFTCPFHVTDYKSILCKKRLQYQNVMA